MSNNCICVIPARLGSKRLPRKVLADLGGKPLMQWAYEQAVLTGLFDRVVLAVDDQELVDVAKDFGAESYLTSTTCQSGTERLIELHSKKIFTSHIWVNWQADEPFITKRMVTDLLDQSQEGVWTLKKQIDSLEEVHSKDVVKVVCNTQGRALYFSRSPIPHIKENSLQKMYAHIGLYAYSSEALEKISTLAPSELERAEKLEQLRWLDHDLPIWVNETKSKSIGIDTKEELALARQLCYNLS